MLWYWIGLVLLVLLFLTVPALLPFPALSRNFHLLQASVYLYAVLLFLLCILPEGTDNLTDGSDTSYSLCLLRISHLPVPGTVPLFWQLPL